jgi:hypothetical protein
LKQGGAGDAGKWSVEARRLQSRGGAGGRGGADMWPGLSARAEREGRGGDLGCRLGGPHELAGLRVVKRRPAACRLGEQAGGKSRLG